MKKFIAILLASLMLLAVTTATADGVYANRLEKIMAEGKIVMATSPDYAPYEFYDLDAIAAGLSGQETIIGSDIELGYYIAEQLGVELVIEEMDFDSVILAISQGTVDIAIAGMVPKEDRAALMDFSSVFNSDGGQCIVIRKADAEKFATLADFDGTLVAAQNGTLQVDLVTEQTTAEIEYITAIPTGIMMLQSNKVAGIALATVVAEGYLQVYDDLAICAEPFVYESLGTVVGVVKGETELLSAINAIVEEAESSGMYAQWRAEANEIMSTQMGTPE